MTSREEPLDGGDVTVGVVRVGDTVRRPTGSHSAVVHRMLDHLESCGFDGSPRVLGTDDRGREVLTYVDGEVAGRPWPEWVGAESRATSVARLLRRMDDCLEVLGLPVDLVERVRSDQPAAAGPAPTFLGHRDVTPENTVFRDGRAHAFIDFDMARPSSRVDEVVNLLLWWAGWMAPEDRSPSLRDIEPAERGRALVEAYGLSERDRRYVVPVAVATAERSWHTMRERARDLGGGWARMWDEGVGDRIRRRERWLEADGDRLHSAMT